MLRILSVLAIVLVARVAAAETSGPAPAGPPRQAGLAERLAELRARLADEPRVRKAKTAVDDADRAFNARLGGDPAINEATRAEAAAREAVGKAERAAAEAHPRVQELRRMLEAARSRSADLELQRRLEEMRAEHLRREARNAPEFRDLAARTQFHPHSPDVLQADPRLAAARKALEETNAAMAARLKELPEYRAREEAQQAYDEAVRASPAAKAADAARRSLDEKIAGDDRVAAQAAKVKAAGDAQAAHQKTIMEIEAKIREAGAEAATRAPAVADAKQALVHAQDRVRTTIAERTAVEQKARDAARVAWRETLEAAIAEKPEAKAIMEEMRSLEERLKQLQGQMDELRRPVSQTP